MMLLSLVWVAGTISGNAVAGNEFDSDQIRRMVAQGEILSLDAILQKHRLLSSGRLLDLEVEAEDRRIIYELELLTPGGNVEKWVVDAQNGELLEKENEH